MSPGTMLIDAQSAPIRVHPEAVAMWRLVGMLWIGGVAVLSSAILGFSVYQPALVLPIVLALPLIFVLHRYSSRYAAAFTAAISPAGFSVRRGVWWHSETFVPRARIQHIEVNHGPLARRFGIATLKVYTAGTHFAEIRVPGLAKTQALALRDDLLANHGSHAV